MATELRQIALDRWFLSALALLGVFALLAWILFRFAEPTETLDEKRGAARVEKLAALRKENDAKLNRYAWLAKDQGTVQIPITRAMELAAQDLPKKSVQASAVKVEDKYPEGLLNPPAPAATPAPGASPASSAAPSAASAPAAAKKP